jgi:hypothetical protein
MFFRILSDFDLFNVIRYQLILLWASFAFSGATAAWIPYDPNDVHFARIHHAEIVGESRLSRVLPRAA